MNKCILIGNLTRDPETSTTPSGVSVCKFSIAVNRNYKTQDGEQETDFFNIVSWRGQAEFCGKFLSKGKKVAVQGSIQNRSYEDKEGNKRTITEIVADQVESLSPKTEDAEQPTRPTKQAKPTLETIEDDLPF